MVRGNAACLFTATSIRDALCPSRCRDRHGEFIPATSINTEGMNISIRDYIAIR